MLADDARRIAEAIEERVNTESGQGIKATVKAEQNSPKTIPAGAGRPVFTRYYIRIEDGARTATVPLNQAGGLLDEVEPGWDPDRLFAAIRALDVPVEDVN
ncbi:MAG: hypothetical protein ACRDTC_08280 [Pseudonocardiaceae bacterium]